MRTVRVMPRCSVPEVLVGDTERRRKTTLSKRASKRTDRRLGVGVPAALLAGNFRVAAEFLRVFDELLYLLLGVRRPSIDLC